MFRRYKGKNSGHEPRYVHMSKFHLGTLSMIKLCTIINSLLNKDLDQSKLKMCVGHIYFCGKI